MLTVQQKKEQLIVLDLEMNPVTNPPHRETASRLEREIIEIGAVRVVHGNVVDDNFQTYVRPSFSSRVSPYIHRLTGIHEGDFVDAPTFKDAIQSLSEWIGTGKGTVICAWSDADRRQITEESFAKNVPLPENMICFEDVQLMHHEKFGADITWKQMALSKAAEQYGINMSKKESHNALYDAKVTAEILIELLSGRYQLQATRLRKAAMEKKKFMSGFLLGDLCKEAFEMMNVQGVGV